MNVIPPKEQQIIAMRESAQRQLSEIKSIDEGVDYLSKAKALEAYAKATKQDAEIVRMVQEQKLRSMRILGQLLKDTELNGGSKGIIQKGMDLPGGTKQLPPGESDPKPRLSDFGITKNESSAYQKIAIIPDDVFEKEINTAKQDKSAVSELTTSNFIRIGKVIESGGVHVSNNSGNNEWYTPERYIQAARKVMGSIDLDPASSKIANKLVRAKSFFDSEMNGLEREWFGNVWLNPPYGQPLINDFSEKTIEEVERGNIKQAIVLTNNATETAWGGRLLGKANAICFHRGRIRFLQPDGSLKDAPLQGQMFCYYGKDAERFIEVFNQFGVCLCKAF